MLDRAIAHDGIAPYPHNPNDFSILSKHQLAMLSLCIAAVQSAAEEHNDTEALIEALIKVEVIAYEEEE
jgi:hypothetical protein